MLFVYIFDQQKCSHVSFNWFDHEQSKCQLIFVLFIWRMFCFVFFFLTKWQNDYIFRHTIIIIFPFWLNIYVIIRLDISFIVNRYTNVSKCLCGLVGVNATMLFCDLFSLHHSIVSNIDIILCPLTLYFIVILYGI